jgi:primosomal protein N' (replication factor Y)
VRDCAASCAELLRAQVAGHPGTCVLGPAEAPIGMLRGRHRHHLLLKGMPGSAGFAAARAALLEFAGTRTRPHVTVDVDPTALL